MKVHAIFSKILVAVSVAAVALCFIDLGAAVAQGPDPSAPMPLTQDQARQAAMARIATQVSAGRAPSWKGASLEAAIPLYDLSGEVSAYLFRVKRGNIASGYLTVAALTIPNPVLEFKPEGVSPIDGSLERLRSQGSDPIDPSRPLYRGLLSYGYELPSTSSGERQVIDLSTQAVSRIRSEDAAIPIRKVIQVQSSSARTPAQPAQYSMISGVPNYQQFDGAPYGYNCKSGCDPTAAVTVMAYWDAQGYSNLINGTDWIGAVNQMRANMGTYCGSDGYGWTNGDNIAPGIIQYAQNKGYTFSSGIWYPGVDATYSNYMNEINAQHPLLLVFQNLDNRTGNNHTITGLGYDSNGSYMYVNDNLEGHTYVQFGSGYSNLWMIWIQAGSTSRPPAAPTNQHLVSTTSSSVTIGWTDASSNESGFKIYRSTGGSFSYYASVGANQQTFTDNGVTCNSTYYYKVSSYNSAGESGLPAGSITATTQSCSGSTIPAAPSNLRVTGTSQSSISLAWNDNSNNESGFKIYKWNGSSWNTWASLGANVTSYTDTSVTCGNTYYYDVSAYNGAGESASANPYATGRTNSCATIPQPPNPYSPGNGSSYAYNYDLTFQWYSSSGATEYQLEWWGGPYSVMQPCGWSCASPFHIGTTIPGNTYYWHVRARNSAGTSSWSNTWSFSIQSQCFTLSTNSNPSGGGSVIVSPSPNCGNQYASGTNVQLTANPNGGYSFGNWSGDATGSTNPTRITMNGSKSVTANFSRTVANNDIANATLVNGLPFNAYQSTAGATTASDDPIFPCGSSNQGSASVWFRYTSASNAHLIVDTRGSDYDTMLAAWRGTRGNLTAVACNDDSSGGTTSLIELDATAGTPYYIEVAQYGSNGNGGSLRLSMVLGSASPTAPAWLQVLTTSITSSSIPLIWTDQSDNETGFRVYRSDGSPTFAYIASVDADVTAFTDTGLPCSTYFDYRVTAYNGVGESGYSHDATGITLACEGPNPPTNLRALTPTVTSSSIPLVWTDNSSNEDGFKIYRWDGSIYAYRATVGANVTSFTDAGLSCKTPYYYSVSAYDSQGERYGWSTEAITTLACPSHRNSIYLYLPLIQRR